MFSENWIFDTELFQDLYGLLDDEEDALLFLPAKLRKGRSKNEYTVEDRYASVFYKTYLLPSEQEDAPIRDPTSVLGRKFLRRFRVPFTVFEEICSDIKRVHHLPDRQTDAKGAETVCLPLLILGSIRYLASGCTFDALEELTNVDQETHRIFFHQKFCTWGAIVSKEHIRMPDKEEELRHVQSLYEGKGLPGCVGSIDCVHVCWDCCPASLHSTCKGKDSVPTLAFEVVSSHTKKILHVSQYFWGTYNDKTIARIDPVFELFCDKNSIINRMQWKSLGADGTEKIHRGGYFICDGGYHKWACLMPPYKHQLPGSALEKWSKNVESVRKDVECVFGILKKHFLFLKHPIRLRLPEQIHRAFVTCCVLHNILNDYNLFDEKNDVEYGVLEESARRIAAASRNGRGVADVRSRRRGVYLHDEDVNDGNESFEDSYQFHERRRNLIDHFTSLTLS